MCYIDLAVKEPDNNVKMIVLDRFKALKDRHGKLLDNLALDLLRVLGSTDLELRRKSVAIMLEMIGSKNVSDVVSFLKKELLKTREQDYEKNSEYRQLLIQAIHQCSIKFPNLAIGISHTLLEFIGDKSLLVVTDIISFLR